MKGVHIIVRYETAACVSTENKNQCLCYGRMMFTAFA